MCYQVSRRPRADNALQMRPGAACLASGRRGARQVKPPLPWRESLRTARPRPKPPSLAEWRAEKQRKWDEDAEQRRERIVAGLRKRFPQRGF